MQDSLTTNIKTISEEANLLENGPPPKTDDLYAGLTTVCPAHGSAPAAIASWVLERYTQTKNKFAPMITIMEENYSYLFNNLFPNEAKPGDRPIIDENLVFKNVIKKNAILMDNNIKPAVLPSGLGAEAPLVEMWQKIYNHCWHNMNGAKKVTDAFLIAQYARYSFIVSSWDAALNEGKGGLAMEIAHPFNAYYDVSAADIESSRWFIWGEPRPVSEMRRKWNNSNINAVRGFESIAKYKAGSIDAPSVNGNEDETAVEIKVWLQDMHTGKVRFIAVCENDLLTDVLEPEKGMRVFPITPIFCYDMPLDWCSVSDVDLVRNIQDKYTREISVIYENIKLVGSPPLIIADDCRPKGTLTNAPGQTLHVEVGEKSQFLRYLEVPQVTEQPLRHTGIMKQSIGALIGLEDSPDSKPNTEQSDRMYIDDVSAREAPLRRALNCIGFALAKMGKIHMRILQNHYAEMQNAQGRESDKPVSVNFNKTVGTGDAEQMGYSPEYIEQNAFKNVQGQPIVNPETNKPLMTNANNPAVGEYDMIFTTSKGMPLTPEGRANLSLVLYDKKLLGPRAALKFMEYPDVEEAAQEMDTINQLQSRVAELEKREEYIFKFAAAALKEKNEMTPTAVEGAVDNAMGLPEGGEMPESPQTPGMTGEEEEQ